MAPARELFPERGGGRTARRRRLGGSGRRKILIIVLKQRDNVSPPLRKGLHLSGRGTSSILKGEEGKNQGGILARWSGSKLPSSWSRFASRYTKKAKGKSPLREEKGKPSENNLFDEGRSLRRLSAGTATSHNEEQKRPFQQLREALQAARERGKGEVCKKRKHPKKEISLRVGAR